MNTSDKENAELLRKLCESWLDEYQRCKDNGYADPSAHYEQVFTALLQRLPAESAQGEDAEAACKKWYSTAHLDFVLNGPAYIARAAWLACAEWKDRVNANYKAQFEACQAELDRLKREGYAPEKDK